VGVEPGADDPLLLLGLDQVLGEDAAELGVAGDVRRGTQLGQRLLLDRVGVGQVLDELFASGGHGPPLPGLRGRQHGHRIAARAERPAELLADPAGA
jgi:hypothetical protein